jgi:hypothetical protein
MVNNTIYRAYFSLGPGNLRMWVFPEQKMIVLYNCEWINFNYTVSPSDLMVRYILPAL